jgi:hypothetical protein
MMRNGRPVDQDFKRWHELYYRFDSAEDIEGEHLLGPRIRASFDISVNWSKYSMPWDVIVGVPDAGIAVFFVLEIQRELPTNLGSSERAKDKPKPHLYALVHEPEEENYSHSAIAVFKDEK